MRFGIRLGAVCALGLTLAAGRSRAQTTAEDEPRTTEDALHAMAQQAAVIFAGQVIAVRRVDGVNGATGVVEIEFAVDDAIRGVSGSTYILREWAGLWNAGGQPLRMGQDYLMLLHAPGAAGMSSPVGGIDGAIPILGGGGSGTREAEAPRLPAASRVVSAAVAADGSSGARTVDLRWVATHVVRAISYAPNSPVHPTALPVAVHANAVAGTRGEAVSNAPGDRTNAGAVAPAITQSAEYAAVLKLLQSWEKSDRGTL